MSGPWEDYQQPGTTLENSPYPAQAKVVQPGPWTQYQQPDRLQSIDRSLEIGGSILNAFGYGAQRGFGSEPIASPATALSDETVKSLKAAGIFHDYTKGRGSFFQDIYEGVIRQGAAALELGLRSGTAALAAPLQAAGQALEETGIAGKGEATGEEGLAGAATDPGVMMALGPLGEAEALSATARAQRAGQEMRQADWVASIDADIDRINKNAPYEPPIPQFGEYLRAQAQTDILRARANGVIGEVDAGFKGTVPPTPDVQAERETATQAVAAQNPDSDSSPQPIAQHLSAKLVEAGRPQAEADAAAAIVQAHYETRSARFAGANGTPEEMYARDFADVQPGEVGGPKGQAAGKTVTKDGRATITLFSKADASTFIHETGHQWLNELVSDAADERAPDQLKSDAAAVRKWAGAPETGDIPTAAHEKFARGFERYVMEGKAPSPQLVPIFEQFKQWLTAIYQRVGALRAPITDDIRGVFDRMLYGDAPKPLAKPAAEVAPVSRATPYEPVPPKPVSLTAWVIANGGLKDVGGDVRSQIGGPKGRPGLLNKNGLGHDDMALAAYEAGYFPQRPTVSEFLEKLDEDQRGNPHYALGDLNAAAAYHGALERNAEIDSLGSDLGIDTAGKTREQFMSEVDAKQSDEDLAELYRSRDEAWAQDFADAEREAKEFLASRGDAWEPDRLEPNGPRTLEDLEREHAEEQASANPIRSQNHAGPSEPPAKDQGQTETVGGQGGSSADAANGNRPQEVPGNPHTRLETESRFIDKAGNIRLDNLNSSEDVNATLRDFAEKNRDFLSARRGIVTDQEVIDYAEANGLSTSDVNIDRLRAMSVEDGVPLAARILGGRQMLVQSAEAVHAAMQGTDELAYAEIAQRHLRVQETLSGITAEWGRAGRAFRQIGEQAAKAQELSQFLKDNTGKTLFQIKREMAAGKRLDSPAKVSGFLREMAKPSYGEMVLEAFKNFLISGPFTHTTYTIGNKLFALYEAIPETAARAAVGTVREMIAGKPVERVHLPEVAAKSYAMFYGQRNGLRAMVDSFKAGQTAPLPGEGSLAALARQKALSEKLTGQELADRIEDLKQNPTPSMQRALASPGPTTGFTSTKAIPGVLGTIIRIPGERMVAPLHAWDRAVGYEVERAALIYRRAQSEGLTGDALTNRIAELTNNTPEDITGEARDNATERALLGKSGAFTGRFGQWIRTEIELPLLGRTQPLSFIEPFVNIGAVINKLALLERTPLGLASREVRDDLSGKNGGIAQDSAIAKMGLGTAVAGTAAGLVMQGWLNGSAPIDRNEAAISLATIGMPHSIVIGGSAYQLNRLGVLGMHLSVAADLYTVAHALEQGEYSRTVGLLVHSIAQNFLDEGYASGIADLMRAIEDSDRYGESYVRNLVSSAVIPFSVGMSQMAKTVDPFAREARTMTDALLAKVPFASQSLYPRRDVWGEKVPNNEFVGVYARQVQSDPVNQALLRLGVFPSMPERRIRGVQLTDQQYDLYQQYSGRIMKRAVGNVVRMGGFARLNPGAQEEILRKSWTEAREQATNRMLMLNNGAILKAANRAKAARAYQGTPAAIARRAGLR